MNLRCGFTLDLRKRVGKITRRVARPWVFWDSRRMVRFSDCPAGTQSPQTAKVWAILHTFVFLSARQSLAIRLSPSHETGPLPNICATRPILCMYVVDKEPPTSRGCVALCRVAETVPRVRIQLSPPRSPGRRETRLHSSENR